MPAGSYHNVAGLVAGVDLGTGSCKVTVSTLKGKALATITKEYQLRQPQPGWAEYDPIDYKLALKKCFSSFNPSLVSRIEAVCIVSARDTVLGIDKDGSPTTKSVTWIDQRARPQEARIRKKIDNARALEINGCSIDFSFMGPKIAWIRENQPAAFRRTRWFVNPSTYLTRLLSGQVATHISGCGRTLLFDIRKREWSEELMHIIGITADRLPTISRKTESLGRITREGLRLTGLSRNTLVCSSHGDDPAAAVAANAVRQGHHAISAATNDVFYVPLSRPSFDPDGRFECSPNASDKWFYELSMNSAGGSLRWFTESVISSKSRRAYDQFEGNAAKVRMGCEGLFYYPFLWGSRVPHNEPNASGVFYGIRSFHSGEHFIRAIMEGVAFQYVGAMKLLSDIGIIIRKAAIVSGGAKSDLWNQIKSDITGIELRAPFDVETSFGAALLAAVAIGSFRSVEDAAQRTFRTRKTYRPNSPLKPGYRRLYQAYSEIADTLLSTYH